MDVFAHLQVALSDPLTILFTVLRVTAVYITLLFFLRLSGGGQFGQLSTVDLVTLLLLSNVVQNAMIGPDDSTVGGVLGAGTLLILYRVTTRILGIQGRLESHPVMLIYQGRVVAERLRREGVSLAVLEEAVLEMNGTISVIPKSEVTPKKLTRVGSKRKKP